MPNEFASTESSGGLLKDSYPTSDSLSSALKRRRQKLAMSGLTKDNEEDKVKGEDNG